MGKDQAIVLRDKDFGLDNFDNLCVAEIPELTVLMPYECGSIIYHLVLSQPRNFEVWEYEWEYSLK